MDGRGQRTERSKLRLVVGANAIDQRRPTVSRRGSDYAAYAPSRSTVLYVVPVLTVLTATTTSAAAAAVHPSSEGFEQGTKVCRKLY